LNCPKCGLSEFEMSAPCPACNFRGEARLLEQLSQLDFLLSEISSWKDLSSARLAALHNEYNRRRRVLCVELGLRPPALDAAGHQAVLLELNQQIALSQALSGWQASGLLDAGSGQELQSNTKKRILELGDRLLDAAPAAPPSRQLQQLQNDRLIASTLRDLVEAGKVRDPATALRLFNSYEKRIVQQETRLTGTSLPVRPLRPPQSALPAAAARLKIPQPALSNADAKVQTAGGELPAASSPMPDAGAAVALAAPARRPPLNWERVVETLLSQRTLYAMLFIGAGLLFAAAISLVVWNWQAFPPWLQVTFLAGFTSIFYALGWYVRTHLKLRESGIALSAVASLLVPLDFYAFYRSGGFPPESWPQVWLLASLVCILIYALAVYLIQSEIFGYLVAIAAASLVAAALQVLHVPLDWWSTALVALGLGMVFKASLLQRITAGWAARWQKLVAPLWNTALLGSASLMLLNLGWWWLALAGPAVSQAPLALTWWLGGLLFCLAAARYRSRTAGLAAAVSFPLAVLLSENLIIKTAGINPVWHAMGLALLAPIYLLLGYWLSLKTAGSPVDPVGSPSQVRSDTPQAASAAAAITVRSERRREVRRFHAGTALAGAAILAVLAAGWSLVNVATAAAVHPLLATTAVLAAGLWRRPALLYITSLLLLTGSAALVTWYGAAFSQVGLAWGVLAALLMIAAVWMGRHHSRYPLYDGPLVVSSGAAAILALLPPLVFAQQRLLAFVLLNLIAIQSWWMWAYLPQAQQPGLPGLLALLAPPSPKITGMRKGWLPSRLRLPSALPHWIVALAWPVWLWAAWTARWPADGRMDVALILMGCILLSLGNSLRRVRSVYWSPWLAAANLSVAAGLLIGVLAFFKQPWQAAGLLLAAAFYFSCGALTGRSSWLYAGGLLLPLGWITGLDWLHVRPEALVFFLAFIPASYVIAAGLLRRRGAEKHISLLPLQRLAWAIGFIAFAFSTIQAFLPSRSIPLYQWSASADLILAFTFALQAWLAGPKQRGRSAVRPEAGFAVPAAHAAVWLAAASAGLLAINLSQGSGISATLAALCAAGYVLLERGLYALRWSVSVTPTWRSTLRKAWQLYCRPLLLAGWIISFGAIVLALFRNLLILGGGSWREWWAALALALVCALYAAAAPLFHRHVRAAQRFAWLAAGLVILPWTLFDLLLWRYFYLPGHGLVFELSTLGLLRMPFLATGWALLAVLMLLTSTLLATKLASSARHWSVAPWSTANLLLPFALYWGILSVGIPSLSFGLGLLFYLLAAWIDRRKGRPSPRFLYPAAFVLPLWSVYLLAQFAPQASHTAYGILLLVIALPYLAFGRAIERGAINWSTNSPTGLTPAGPASDYRSYGLPLYLAANVIVIVGTLLMVDERPALIAALLFDTLFYSLSAWNFSAPLWIYPAAATFPAAVLMTLAEIHVPGNRLGWGMIAIGAFYLGLAALMRRAKVSGSGGGGTSGQSRLYPYSAPLIVAALAIILAGLPASSQDNSGAIAGYAAAALLYAVAAVWLVRPVLFSPAVLLSAVPYWLALPRLGIAPADYSLALWPGILAALTAAWWADRQWGVAARPGVLRGGGVLDSFPWKNIFRWPVELLERLVRWWAFPLYIAASLGAAISILISGNSLSRQALAFALASGAYAWLSWRFRSRGWLFITLAAIQLSLLTCLRWMGKTAPEASLTRLVLAFSPIIWLTTLVGLAVQLRRGEPPPFDREREAVSVAERWSRPFYLLVAIDLLLSQLVALAASGSSAWITLSQAGLIALLASTWQVRGRSKASPVLAYAALGLGAAALCQGLSWAAAAWQTWPWALALLTLAYGLAGYLLRFILLRKTTPAWLAVWEKPLCYWAWLLSAASLFLALVSGVNVIQWAIRIALDLPLFSPVDAARVRMLTGVFAVLGLFYLAAAVVGRRRWLGYSALGLLLAAWCGELLLVWGQRQLQWYALPAGLYLLGVGYLEWRLGSRPLARWIDRAAVLLLLGSAFWQSLGPQGGRYALLMGIECLLLLWWGSARRLRFFLYAGVGGMTVNVIAQLVEPLLSANRWIVFGVAGLLLVGLAILVERRLESVRVLSQELRERLEQWE
jgi:hypothetical protein